MKFWKFFGEIQGYLIGISSVDIQGIYHTSFVYEVLVLWYKGYCNGASLWLFSWLGGW